MLTFNAYVHTLRYLNATVNSGCICVELTCMHWCLYTCIHAQKTFLQLISLSIKRHSIHVHVDAAGFTAAHPTNGSAVEGRPAGCVMLVHHGRLWVQFGSRFGQLKLHELVGFLKATEGHGAPGKNRGEVVITARVLPLQSQAWNEEPVKTFPFGDILLWNGSRHWCFEGGDQFFVTLHGFLPWRNVWFHMWMLVFAFTSTSCKVNIHC